MKKALSLFVVGLLLAASPSFAKTTEWTMATFAFLTHPVTVNATLPWLNMIEKASQGALIIMPYGPNGVCPDGEVFASVEGGVIEMGYQLATRNPGRFPYLEMADLPMLFANAPAAALTMRDLIAQFPEMQEEFKGLTLLNVGAATLMQIGTTKKPVRNLEDLKGLKIGSMSPQGVKALNALGATGVVIAFSDVYMALERGMVDGLLMPAVAFKGTKTNELLKFFTESNLYSGAVISVVNSDVWNSLDAGLKAQIEPVMDILPMLTNKVQIGLDDAMMAECPGLGVEVIRLDAAERQRWMDKVVPLHDDWVKSMQAKGFNSAPEVLAAAKKITANYESDNKAMKIMDEVSAQASSFAQ